MTQECRFHQWLGQPVAVVGPETTPCGDEASALACGRGFGLGCHFGLGPVTRRIVLAEVAYCDWNGDLRA